MTDAKVEELVLTISTQLATLNEQTKQVLATLTKHEERLTKLEDEKTGLKDTLIQWLAKGLVASTLTIGTLTGAAGLIAKFFGG